MESPSEAAGGLGLMEKSALLRVLRKVVECKLLPQAQAADSPDGEEEEELSRNLEALWDACVDPVDTGTLVAHNGIAVLAEAAERAGSQGRSAEVCLGALANVCSHSSVLESAISPENLEVLCTASLRAMSSPDGLVVIQALRVACGLLCSSIAPRCTLLWSSAALQCYLFILEHSLRWTAVQLACDALSQGLLLEAQRGDATPEAEGQEDARRSLLPSLQRSGVLRLLVSRATELLQLAEDAAVDLESTEETENAMLSALCSAESYLALLPAAPEDSALLCTTAVRCVLLYERVDIQGAALQLLDSLLVSSEQEPKGHGCVEEPQGEDLMTQLTNLCESSANLVEKLALFLADKEPSTNEAVQTALHLLGLSPPAELLTNDEALVDAAVMLSEHEARGALQLGPSATLRELLVRSSRAAGKTDGAAG